VQYIRIIASRKSWMAQKCGHTISASIFSLPATNAALARIPTPVVGNYGIAVGAYSQTS